MTAMVPFTVDGRAVTAPEGELLVHALARNDVFVPTLCHDTSSTPTAAAGCAWSASRGRRGRLPACATRVAEGMVVSTNSSVPQFQRTLTEMLLAEHLNAQPRRAAERADRRSPRISASRRRSCSRTRSASRTRTATC